MSRFVATPGFEPRLERQAGVVNAVAQATGRAETDAKRLAEPVSRRFAEGIDSDIGFDNRGVLGRVNAHWWGSLFVEFGTARQRPHAILRRTLDAMRRTR